MQCILYTEILSVVNESGFSLDELVIKTKKLFEEQGMPGFLQKILTLIDEKIYFDIIRGEPGWRPHPCCNSPVYVHHDRRDRSFRTSVGKISISWLRLRCKNCGKTVVPLREFLGIDKYQTKSNELEKIVTEVMSEQTYRRGSRHLETIGEIPVPRSTAHRWVMHSACDELDSDENHFDLIFADGTGFKRRPDPERDVSNRGEVRVVLGVQENGQVRGLGAYSGLSWDEIGKRLEAVSERPGSLAHLLLSDGEIGLAEGLANLVNDNQRCHWHAVHDLDYVMWQDDAGKAERVQMQRRLTSLIGVELPEEDFEKVAEDDKDELLRQADDAKKGVEAFAWELMEKGYTKAAKYVINVKDKLFNYVKLWLDLGLVSPRAASMIERMMREIGRRLKRMAFGWSEEGAAKMTRIIIKRFASAKEWDEYWEKILRIDNKVFLFYRGVKAK